MKDEKTFLNRSAVESKIALRSALSKEKSMALTPTIEEPKLWVTEKPHNTLRTSSSQIRMRTYLKSHNVQTKPREFYDETESIQSRIEKILERYELKLEKS